MKEHAFSLVSFSDTNIPDIQITGKISRRNNFFSIQYFLTWSTETILLPERSPQPARKDELWRATCFEFFLAIPDQLQYWEFNLSPSGDWNAYHMTAYRRVGFREETLIERLPFTVQEESGCVSVDASLDLSPLIPAEYPIQVAITSMIKTKAGHESYWALTHPKPQPDFHLRESFILALEE